MVKRRTKYSLMYQKLDDVEFGNWTYIPGATTKKGFDRKFDRHVPIDCHQIINWRESWFRSNGNLIRPDRVLKRSLYRAELTDDRLIDLAAYRSIRAMWHRWNELMRPPKDGAQASIIPDGFRVLANKYEAMPTALSIRNRLKSLIPKPYNCYLLDRDLRRYLGLELRHD